MILIEIVDPLPVSDLKYLLFTQITVYALENIAFKLLSTAVTLAGFYYKREGVL